MRSSKAIAASLAFFSLLIPSLVHAEWRAMGPGLNDEVYALTTYNGDVIAGGRFTRSGTTQVPFIARWDGTAWNPIPGWSYGQIQALTVWNGKLIAGGWTGVAAWDGTTWHDLGAGINGRVNALCEYQGDLIAAGDFQSTGDGPATRIARWNGVSWSPMGAGFNDLVFAVTTFNGTLYAGGFFTSPPNIARWDGSEWRWNGPTLEWGVYSFAEYNRALYVCGAFMRPASFIARWNGMIWSPLGSGADFYVLCVLPYLTDLVAGGYFYHVGGVLAPFIGRWDGSAWSALGSGMDFNVYCLTVHYGDLIAGGSFSIAGGQVARHVAVWHEPTLDVTAVASSPRVQVAPNPLARETNLSFHLPRAERVVVTVYDTQGRRVRALFDGMRTGGEQSIRWDGRDDAGRDLPAGVFIAKVATESETLTRRVVITR